MTRAGVSVCDSVVGYGSVEFACQLPVGHDGDHLFRELEFTVTWADLPALVGSWGVECACGREGRHPPTIQCELRQVWKESHDA